MNITNIDVHPPTIKAAYIREKDHIHQTAILDSYTGSVLDIDSIKYMVDELIEAHGNWMPKFH